MNHKVGEAELWGADKPGPACHTPCMILTHAILQPITYPLCRAPCHATTNHNQAHHVSCNNQSQSSLILSTFNKFSNKNHPLFLETLDIFRNSYLRERNVHYGQKHFYVSNLVDLLTNITCRKMAKKTYEETQRNRHSLHTRHFLSIFACGR